MKKTIGVSTERGTTGLRLRRAILGVTNTYSKPARRMKNYKEKGDLSICPLTDAWIIGTERASS